MSHIQVVQEIGMTGMLRTGIGGRFIQYFAIKPKFTFLLQRIMNYRKNIPNIDFNALYKSMIETPNEVIKAIASSEFVLVPSNEEYRVTLTNALKEKTIKLIFDGVADCFNIYPEYLALIQGRKGHIYFHFIHNPEMNDAYRELGFTFDKIENSWCIYIDSLDAERLQHLQDFIASEYMIVICLDSGAIYDSEGVTAKEPISDHSVQKIQRLPQSINVVKDDFAHAFYKSTGKDFAIVNRGLSIFNPIENTHHPMNKKDVILSTKIPYLLFRVSFGSYYIMYPYYPNKCEIGEPIYKADIFEALERYRTDMREMVEEDFF